MAASSGMRHGVRSPRQVGRDPEHRAAPTFVELKRHGTSTTVDLQAIKYAACVAGCQFHDVVSMYAAYISVPLGRRVSLALRSARRAHLQRRHHAVRTVFLVAAALAAIALLVVLALPELPLQTNDKQRSNHDRPVTEAIALTELPGSERSRRFDGEDHGTVVSFFLMDYSKEVRGPELHRHAYDEIFRRRRDGHDGGAPEPEEVDEVAKRSADYRPPAS